MEELAPETIELGEFRLRRARPEDAERVAGAVAANLDHLARFMPWANDESASVDFQRSRLVSVVNEWDEGRTFQYVAESLDGVLLGVFGVERRAGPRAVDIGYWLTREACGRGYTTRSVKALTEAALAMDGIDRVEVHCDEGNERSAAVPRRLGFRLDRIVDAPKLAWGETGRKMIWVDH